MNPRHFLLLTVGIFLVTLIACSKDTDEFSLDADSTKTTSTRNLKELSIRYQMTTSQNIKPIEGALTDLCALDIKVLNVPNSETNVTATVGSDGQSCITMINKTQVQESGKPNRPGKRFSKPTTTSYCNGILTYTDEQGKTTTIDSEIDVTMFQTIYESYYYTETQKDSVMNAMVIDAEKNGAKVTTNGNALTITQRDQEGNTETIVYDIENHVVVSNYTTDRSGKIISKSMLGYKCTADGKIIPDFIVSYNYNDNMICSDPIYAVEQIKFNNFNITL